MTDKIMVSVESCESYVALKTRHMGKTIDDYIVGHSGVKNRDRSDGKKCFYNYEYFYSIYFYFV